MINGIFLKERFYTYFCGVRIYLLFEQLFMQYGCI